VQDVKGTYERIARSIAAYERSPEVNTFSSKFDLFWNNAKETEKDATKIKFSADSGGTGAAATATLLNGSVTSVAITNGGSGYIVAPVISFMGGMGSGAAAAATVENGAVIAITVTNGGSGYRMAPRVTITGVDPYSWQNYRNLGLTDAELQGLAAFNDPDRANCASCHSLKPGPKNYPIFTDFSYHNLGMPKNPENPFYAMPKKWNPDGADWVDYGLGGFLKIAGYALEVYEPEFGKHKVPTLRNVDLRPYPDFVKTYGHNGYFKSLEDIIFFYRWRGMMDGMGGGGGGMGGGMGGGGMDMDGGGGMSGPMFAGPEVNQNLATLKMFNMMDQANILAFLKTLSDGYIPQ
jgi:cytochrome c peroxidase